MMLQRNPIQNTVRPCELLLLNGNGDLGVALAFKRKHQRCRIHSSSAAHRRRPNVPGSDIFTYPFHIDPNRRTEGDFVKGGPANRRVSITALMRFIVGRSWFSSIVINMYNANIFLPIFLDNSIFREASMYTCQLNVAYPKPKTLEGMTLFRRNWKRIVNGRNFLLISVSRNKDTMHMFLVSINGGFCWNEYISDEPFDKFRAF
ncbi:hypothetical protein Q1695_005272 [Nippostrongylus brasiliensis]|nr:hypothetical protein Q1695_005272 [Nippostrongylus brasiliensis]